MTANTAALTSDQLTPATLLLGIDDFEGTYREDAVGDAALDGDLTALYSYALTLVRAALGTGHSRLGELCAAWDSAAAAAEHNYEDEGALQLQDAAALAAWIIRDTVCPEPVTPEPQARFYFFDKTGEEWEARVAYCQALAAVRRLPQYDAAAAAFIQKAYRALHLDADVGSCLCWSACAHGEAILKGSPSPLGWKSDLVVDGRR